MAVLCPEGPLAERLRAQGAAVTTGAFGPTAGVVASIVALRDTARALRPQIVHTHLAYADIVSAITPLPHGTRRFTTEHGIAGDDSVYHRSSTRASTMALIHRLRIHRFNGVIAVSQATRNAMQTKWHVNSYISVIPNGVDLPPDTERRTPRSVEGMRILALSRLAPEKGIPDLIRAFVEVVRKRPDATLTIAGDGPLRRSLNTQIRTLGLGRSVHLPGFLDAQRAMDNADILVQLSAWENCSYTLLDAVAAGLRVVAANVGGNKEILEPALLVDASRISDVSEKILLAPQGSISRISTVNTMTQRIGAAYTGQPCACREQTMACESSPTMPPECANF